MAYDDTKIVSVFLFIEHFWITVALIHCLSVLLCPCDSPWLCVVWAGIMAQL